ncbi:hypothetical protein CEE44_02400 [Candidatus Woesearchaeota archaeon B3_Woes]|nr:MAG: hypothetical protein CEE44_02400 [Candidatus Woesearchaeota archaeon B3_Woes]
MVKGTYERVISKRRFALSLILTSFIFLIGILVGYTLTAERTDYLEEISYKQKIDYESLQLQSLYLDLSATNVSCHIFNKILETSLNDVGKAQSKVDFYIQETSKKSYTELKRGYLLAQIRYWLLNQKIKENCQAEHVSVLYFYSNEECVECGAQSTVLSYLKEKLKDRLLVFSLDADFRNEPMVGVLKQTYNITKIPSVVIEDSVFDKLIGKDDLIQEICKNYKEKPELCVK